MYEAIEKTKKPVKISGLFFYTTGEEKRVGLTEKLTRTI
jgi:hypothetical protein